LIDIETIFARLLKTTRRVGKRAKRAYQRNLNITNSLRTILVIGALVAFILPTGSVEAVGSTTQTASIPVLVSLTSDIVSAKQPTVTIEVTDSIYSQEQQQKAELAKKAETAKKLAIAQTVTTVSVSNDASFDQKRALAQSAAAAYGIDWKVLEAVWQVESGKQWKTTVTSWAGAHGPCQFMPGTWRTYAVDGNNDGVKDATSAQDCLYGAAKLLATNGASTGNVTQALLHYNHSLAYVQKVLRIAASI